MTRPLFILDLDETIIGNIIPQLNEYFLLNKIKPKNRCVTKNHITNLKHDFLNGIIRPFFKMFIDYCKNKNRFVFIYTAGTSKWTKFIIPIIEDCIGFKFQRPLFTREHMVIIQNNYYKSIEKIKPIISRTLNKNKVGHLYKLDNIIMIDNRTDNVLEKNYVVKCPPYNPTIYINPLRSLTEEEIHSHIHTISNVFFDDNKYDYNTVMISLYSTYVQNIKYTQNNKNNYSNDNFWKLLTRILETSFANKISTKIIIKKLQVLGYK